MESAYSPGSPPRIRAWLHRGQASDHDPLQLAHFTQSLHSGTEAGIYSGRKGLRKSAVPRDAIDANVKSGYVRGRTIRGHPGSILGRLWTVPGTVFNQAGWLCAATRRHASHFQKNWISLQVSANPSSWRLRGKGHETPVTGFRNLPTASISAGRSFGPDISLAGAQTHGDVQ